MKTAFSVLCGLAAVASTVAVFYFNTTIGIIQACIFAALMIAAFIVWFVKTRSIKEMARRASKYFETTGRSDGLPMPALVADENGTVIWFNSLFENEVLPGDVVSNEQLSDILGDIRFEVLCAAEHGTNIVYNSRNYVVFAEKIDDGKSLYCLYFIDNTELKSIAEEYKNSRPVVVQMKIDNLDEVYQNYKNSECEVISGELERILESWAGKTDNVFRRVGSGKYFMITDERGLSVMISKKFEALKMVGDFKYGDKPVEITLSMGIGHGGNLFESDEFSKQALEMSQSRGGDQATVNNNGELEFFGGTVSGSTKRSKIKARLIANAFADHVSNADAVFVMGHCFSDLDSVGASVGVYAMVKALDKPCYIVVNKKKSMAKNLIENLEADTLPDTFINGSKAADFCTSKSLLVIVDTHREASLDYSDILRMFDKVIVLDHHRRTANYINDTILYYDEPNASSACEMVTELIQYIPVKVDVSPMCAEALLSGIMLDTRNFVLSTGSRTFEAAAFLKENGANTISAKQLFANNIENYKQKNNIISTAVTYKGCAVAIATEHFHDMRITASQVADELLNIAGIKSSYVLFEEDGVINISARSLGEMNVQVIMEHLGGGGHLTMAATQLEGVTMGDAVVKLEGAINEYFEENKQ